MLSGSKSAIFRSHRLAPVWWEEEQLAVMPPFVDSDPNMKQGPCRLTRDVPAMVDLFGILEFYDNNSNTTRLLLPKNSDIHVSLAGLKRRIFSIVADA